jgi:adenylate cyclase class 2
MVYDDSAEEINFACPTSVGQFCYTSRMEIEYEAVFTNIDKDVFRETLKAAGAELKRAEYMMTRSAFHLPNMPVNGEGARGWARVRDEGNKITMSVKVIDGEGIESQKESCVVIDNFKQGVTLLTAVGCVEKAHQESKRELWMLDGVEVTIDTWPFLEPFVEVEGKSEASVRTVSEKLGFAWADAKFCAVDTLFSERYGISQEQINNNTPHLVFDMENPFA